MAMEADWNSPTDEVVKLGLASALKSCSAKDIGISPDHIPSWVQTTLPLSLIQPQLASGKVTLRLADILRGLEPEMRHLLAPTRQDLEVVLPANEVFHALPVGNDSAVPAVPAVEPPAAPESTVKLPAGVPWPFESKAHSTPEPVAPPPMPFTVPETPFTAFTPAEEAAPIAPPKQATPLPAVAERETISAFPPAAQPAPAPFPAASPQAPAFAWEPSSFPAPAAEATAKEPATSFSFSKAEPHPGPSVSVVRPTVVPRASAVPDKHRQMLLRVLLGSQDDDFDAEAVIRRTLDQPGVAAAVCFHDGRQIAHAGNGSAEADNFLRQARSMVEHVEPLVQLTGIDDTETLNLKSDRHVITFSLQGDVTLAVLHDPQRQEPTLREKVTLIARELTGLLQAA
jgi:hypothetical protein